MAKNSKKRKTDLAAKVPLASKKIKYDTTAQEQENPHETPISQGVIGGVLYEDELETTTDTLLLLAQNPSLISLKTLKPFKTAVHEYWRVAHETTGTGNSLTSRISSALVDHRHTDALVLLSEMLIRGQVPKLGALQRWVRECDAVLTPEMSQEEENRVWEVLNAILRTTQPELVSRSSTSEEGVLKPGTRLWWYPPFTVEPDTVQQEPDADADAIAASAIPLLQPLQITPGPDRRPPNKHPAVIYHSPPNTFPLSLARTRNPTRHDVPGVPSAFVINDALEAPECDALVRAAEGVGLIPDEPIGGSGSVLAHNLIWLADEVFIEGLYNRLVHLLPPSVCGGKVRGINRRFRLYRYKPGALYRPHIDGAWPASSSSPATPTSPASYIYDSDPTVYSRLTFLIYLNDDFDGGCTTFFLPSEAKMGTLDARGVKPRKGSVCVFPHGKASGSLLHEGSGVTRGAKYVIRTEVLYEVDKSERVDAAKD
ncbi:hypothetical protein M413DRAFT_443685 [Hebeloma cylindrosporum]|uniref:Fe2OG dioxygenase domain-containing protein n=1 Tax=Hebeloma cylindrosporum TaxID=76867 RepID=A0A0C2YRX9_HEBCY|nr:hypothetical protein M413DRAFT_443685 [Hebeloma cylindrosporum h7]